MPTRYAFTVMLPIAISAFLSGACWSQFEKAQCEQFPESEFVGPWKYDEFDQPDLVGLWKYDDIESTWRLLQKSGGSKINRKKFVESLSDTEPVQATWEFRDDKTFEMMLPNRSVQNAKWSVESQHGRLVWVKVTSMNGKMAIEDLIIFHNRDLIEIAYKDLSRHNMIFRRVTDKNQE